MDTAEACTHCTICHSSFFEVFHGPVVQACHCASRICESCAPALPAPRRCPTCRQEASVGLGVDAEFLVTVAREARVVHCEGCRARMSSRLLGRHLEKCPQYLLAKYAETMEENALLRRQYRSCLETNATLTGQLDHNAHVIHYLRTGLEAYQQHMGHRHHHEIHAARLVPPPPPPPRRRILRSMSSTASSSSSSSSASSSEEEDGSESDMETVMEEEVPLLPPLVGVTVHPPPPPPPPPSEVPLPPAVGAA